MKDYTNNTPEFNRSITITEETDPGHADIINAAPKQLLENTLVLKSEIDALDENIRKSGLLDNVESGDGEESSNRLDAMQGDIEALQVPEFTELDARENINPGDSQKTLWGKVKKWFSDLKSGAFASIVNNCTTTEEGTVLDGRQGKALQEQIVELREADSEINSNIDVLKKSVADGKALIASAITNKGVATEAGAAFEIMAANVQKIKNGYTTKSQYIEIFM